MPPNGGHCPIRMHAVAPTIAPRGRGFLSFLHCCSSEPRTAPGTDQTSSDAGWNNYTLCLSPTSPSITHLLSFCPSTPSTGLSSGAFQPCPGQLVPHAYPQGCSRKLTANSYVPSTGPCPLVALPVCQGQVTFESHGIIKAAPNCLCLCISLTYPWIGSY